MQTRRMQRASRRRLALVEQRERDLRAVPGPQMGRSKNRRHRIGRRGITAGQLDRLSNHFKGTFASLDDDLINVWSRLVARSRELALNESYMRRFLQLADTSVIGRSGIRLQSQAKRPDGEPDDLDREMLEAAWKEWTKRQHCDIRRKRTFKDIQSGFTKSLLRDGESLTRIIQGAPNDFRFALQPLDPMLLDSQLNGAAPRGVSTNKIVMGVELDKWTRPVFYWILQKDSSENTISYHGRHYLRLPADDVIHEFLMGERADQNRGVPAAVAAILRLEMLHGAEEAELTAARISACKMGGYKTDGTGKYSPDDEDDDGNLTDEAVPGMMQMLPAGVEMEMWDPKHPNGDFPAFTRLMLMGAGAGLGVSYPSFANDPTGTSYSTLRHFAIEEREYWRALTDFVRDALCERVFERWLRTAFLTGKLNAPPRRFEKFREVTWQGRGFPWIDPLKEQKAIESSVLSTQTRTRTSVLLEQGVDPEEHFATLQREARMAKKYGVVLNAEVPAMLPDPQKGEDE